MLVNLRKFNAYSRSLSWQMFIGLNWPYVEGKPQPKISSPGTPLYGIDWKESYEVFKEDGSKPSTMG